MTKNLVHSLRLSTPETRIGKIRRRGRREGGNEFSSSRYSTRENLEKRKNKVWEFEKKKSGATFKNQLGGEKEKNRARKGENDISSHLTFH